MVFHEYLDEKEKAVPGAEDTENGKANQSNFSLSESNEKVKSLMPLDHRTEMFMLNAVKKAMNRVHIESPKALDILSYLISMCAEASGI